MSRARTIGSVVLVASSIVMAGCKAPPSGITDRPELSDAMIAARQTAAPEALWKEWVAPPADGHYYDAATGDVNGDGNPDLVAGSFEPGGVAIWLGQSNGSWELSFIALPSSEVRDVALADTDGDGRDEILIVSRGGIEGLLILSAPKEGPWGRPDVISATAGYESLETADINSDGSVDLVVTRGGDRTDGGIEVFLGNGRGEFVIAIAPQTGGSFRHALIAELNGDDHLDLAAAGWGFDGGVRLFYGEGDGGFVAGPTVGVPGFYRRIAVGDVDGNGRPDLIATTYRSGVRVFLNLGPQTEVCSLIDDGSFWSPLVTDADGDGSSEIYATSSNGLGILAWTWEQNCEFTPVATGLPDRNTWFGLFRGELHLYGPDALIAAGHSDGIRAFGPSGTPEPRVGEPRIVLGPDAAEERWAGGNETFTTALGFDEYRLGVNDVVRIRVSNGEGVEEVKAVVQSDGDVFVPARGIGSIPAAGKSPTQLKQAVLERAGKIWRDPGAEVVVLDYHAHKVSLLGEVRSSARSDSGPGQYALEGKTRVVDFLSKHGGPSESADLSRVQMIQFGGRSTYLNVYKAVLSSDQRENPILNDGDTVFVPSIALSNRRLIVLGEVTNPGMVEIRENITLLEAIARTGGFTDRARLQTIFVISGGLESPEVVTLNLRDALRAGDLSTDIVLRSGDIVYVPHRRIVNFQQVMKSIQPIFDLALDTLILRELVRD